MTNNHQNLRAVLLARCSTEQQVQYSVPRQLKDMHHFAKREGIAVVAEIKLEGVSGMNPTAREDIDEIKRRKFSANDFDIVLIPCVDRLTRGGPQHGFWIMQEFEFSGIEVASVKNDIPDSEEDWAKLGQKFHQARQEVDDITRRMMHGASDSILDGRNPHAFHTPYGVDRLYSSIDTKEPLHRIRNLPDGTQVMLGVTGETPLRTFPRRMKNEKSPHYKRQPNECVTFIPGSPDSVDVVRRIFAYRFLDGIGSFRIATILNGEGKKTLHGFDWQTGTIDRLVTNPVYFGVGIGNRSTDSDLYKRGVATDTAPIKRARQKVSRDTAKAKRLKNGRRKSEMRAPEEWIEKAYPAMVDYLSNLDGALRSRILTGQRAEYNRKALGIRKQTAREKGGDNHTWSTFILKNLLISLPDHRIMIGARSGIYRYYAMSKAMRAPSPNRRGVSVDADVVEREILDATSKVLRSVPNLDNLVMQSIQRFRASNTHIDPSESTHLKARRATLLVEIGRIGDAHADLSAEELDIITKEKKEEAKAIGLRLKNAASSETVSSVRDEDMAKEIATLLQDGVSLVSTKESLPRLKTLLRILISRLEFNTETKVLEADFSLPSWVIGVGEPPSCDQRPVATSCTQHNNGAQIGTLYSFGTYAWQYVTGRSHTHPAMRILRAG